MTRKHYNAIAATIREQVNEISPTDKTLQTIVRRNTLYHTAEKLAIIMADDNARFDTSRFLRACGF